MKCNICEEDDNDCYCPQCSVCKSKNLEYFDDGDGYPPNILCKDCENWNQ